MPSTSISRSPSTLSAAGPRKGGGGAAAAGAGAGAATGGALRKASMAEFDETSAGTTSIHPQRKQNED
jgi:hypothetical protein